MTMPVLVVFGRQDILCDSDEVAGKVRAALPHAQVEMLDDCGHMVNVRPARAPRPAPGRLPGRRGERRRAGGWHRRLSRWSASRRLASSSRARRAREPLLPEEPGLGGPGWHDSGAPLSSTATSSSTAHGVPGTARFGGGPVVVGVDGSASVPSPVVASGSAGSWGTVVDVAVASTGAGPTTGAVVAVVAVVVVVVAGRVVGVVVGAEWNRVVVVVAGRAAVVVVAGRVVVVVGGRLVPDGSTGAAPGGSAPPTGAIDVAGVVASTGELSWYVGALAPRVTRPSRSMTRIASAAPPIAGWRRTAATTVRAWRSRFTARVSAAPPGT